MIKRNSCIVHWQENTNDFSSLIFYCRDTLHIPFSKHLTPQYYRYWFFSHEWQPETLVLHPQEHSRVQKEFPKRGQRTNYCILLSWSAVYLATPALQNWRNQACVWFYLHYLSVSKKIWHSVSENHKNHTPSPFHSCLMTITSRSPEFQ